jgi:hypothetical protein
MYRSFLNFVLYFIILLFYFYFFLMLTGVGSGYQSNTLSAQGGSISGGSIGGGGYSASTMQSSYNYSVKTVRVKTENRKLCCVHMVSFHVVCVRFGNTSSKLMSEAMYM